MSDHVLDDDRATVAAWFEAIQRPGVAEGIRAIHEDIASEVAERRPICLASGQCCNFDRFGHRLYVTGLDVAWCVASLRERRQVRLTMSAVDAARQRGDCPFLEEGRLCGAHVERPLGCRIYFCDRSSTHWHESLYERTHQAMIAIHQAHAIPYRYGEWRAMLALVASSAGE